MTSNISLLKAIGIYQLINDFVDFHLYLDVGYGNQTNIYACVSFINTDANYFFCNNIRKRIYGPNMKFNKRTLSETLTLLFSKQEQWQKRDGSLNVSAAAKGLNMNQSALKRILDGESSQPSIENGDRLTNHFKVTRDQLIGLKPIECIDGKEAISEAEKLSDNYFANAIGDLDQAQRERLDEYIQFMKTLSPPQ